MAEMKPIPPTATNPNQPTQEPKPAPPKEDEKPKVLHAGYDGLRYK